MSEYPPCKCVCACVLVSSIIDSLKHTHELSLVSPTSMPVHSGYYSTGLRCFVLLCISLYVCQSMLACMFSHSDSETLLWSVSMLAYVCASVSCVRSSHMRTNTHARTNTDSRRDARTLRNRTLQHKNFLTQTLALTRRHIQSSTDKCTESHAHTISQRHTLSVTCIYKYICTEDSWL